MRSNIPMVSKAICMSFQEPMPELPLVTLRVALICTTSYYATYSRQLLHQNIITQMPVAMDNQLGQFEALMSAIAPMSPEYHRLRRVIKEPEGFCAPEDPMFRQVWAADLTGAEIKSLFEVAHKQLERAIKAKVAALQMELDKLSHVLARGFPEVGHEDPEDLKSDVCQLVLQRWSHESAVEEMTGRKAIGRHLG
ncbi:hypothetical protein LTS09_008906 [Friedmanniomyces endolithicus]|nr:hypothetical protein LTS09_008906 [Friedmanniomyces endolithicus]